MLHIVLDANAIFEDGRGLGNRTQELLSIAQALQFQVHVPEVALVEVVGRFSRDLADKLGTMQGQIRTLSWVVSRKLHSPIDPSETLNETQLFRDRLTDRFAGADVKILEYPTVPHEQIVNRAASRTKPFDKNGSGYRDTLIWFNILELAAAVDGQIVLVTRDDDFRGDHGNLHEDLVNDLTTNHQPSNRVVLTNSIKDIMEEHIVPRVQEAFMEEPLETFGRLGFDAKHLIIEAIENSCSTREWNPLELGLSWKCESTVLDVVEEITLLTVGDSREIHDNVLSTDVYSDLIATFTVCIPEMDWPQAQEDPRLRPVNLDPSDDGFLAAISLPLRCDLELVINPRNVSQWELNVGSFTLVE